MPFLLPPIFSAAISRLSVYLVLIVSARLLDPQNFGAYAVLTTVAGVVNALVSGGGDMWLNRFTRPGRSHRAPYIWQFYTTISGVIALNVLAIGSVVSFWLPEAYGFRTAFLLALVGASLSGLTETLLAVIRASGQVFYFFAIRDVGAPLGFLALILTFQPRSAVAMMILFISIWLLALTLTLILVQRHASPLGWRQLRRRVKAWRQIAIHTMGLIYGNFGARLAAYIDVLVLSGLISLAAIGQYRVAAQFAIGFVVVQHFVFLGLPWQMAALGSKGLPGRGYQTFLERQRWLIVMATGGFLLLSLIAEPLLTLFGQRFRESTLLLQILLLLRYGDLLWGPQHEALVSRGKIIDDAHCNVIAIAIWSLVFSTFYFFGVSPIAAAVCATAAASLGGQGSRYRMIRHHGLPPLFGHPLGVLPPVVLTLTSAALALGFLQGGSVP